MAKSLLTQFTQVRGSRNYDDTYDTGNNSMSWAETTGKWLEDLTVNISGNDVTHTTGTFDEGMEGQFITISGVAYEITDVDGSDTCTVGGSPPAGSGFTAERRARKNLEDDLNYIRSQIKLTIDRSNWYDAPRDIVTTVDSGSTDNEIPTAEAVYEWVNTVSGAITSSDTFAGLEDTPAGYSEDEIIFYTSSGTTSNANLTFDPDTNDFNAGAAGSARISVDSDVGTTVYGDADTYLVVSGTSGSFVDNNELVFVLTNETQTIGKSAGEYITIDNDTNDDIEFGIAGSAEMTINTNGMKLATGADVNDITTTITAPGDDDTLATEKAIVDYIDTVSGTIEHNNLLGLQGGDTDEYYHLNTHEEAQISATTDTVLNLGDVAGTNAKVSINSGTGQVLVTSSGNAVLNLLPSQQTIGYGTTGRITLSQDSDDIYLYAGGNVALYLDSGGINLSQSTQSVDEILNTADADSINASSTDSQLATAKLIYNYINTVSGTTEHNNLLGLQGGDTDEYYHLNVHEEKQINATTDTAITIGDDTDTYFNINAADDEIVGYVNNAKLFEMNSDGTKANNWSIYIGDNETPDTYMLLSNSGNFNFVSNVLNVMHLDDDTQIFGVAADTNMEISQSADTITFEAANTTEMVIGTGGMKLKNSTATVNEILNTVDADSISSSSTDDQLATAKLIYNFTEAELNTLSGSLQSIIDALDHDEDLNGLNGGSGGEYWHVSQNVYDAMSSDGATLFVVQDIDLDGDINVSGTLSFDGGTAIDNIVTEMSEPGSDTNLVTEQGIVEYVDSVSGTLQTDIIWEIVDTPTTQIRPKVEHLQKAIYTEGNVTIGGNLTVTGTLFYADTETVQVQDNLLVINYGEVGAGVTAGEAGIQVDRGSETDYLFLFDEGTDTFRIGVSGTQSSFNVAELQPVATREDNPIDTRVAWWDADDYTFRTQGDTYITVASGAGAGAINAVVDSTNYLNLAAASQRLGNVADYNTIISTAGMNIRFGTDVYASFSTADQVIGLATDTNMAINQAGNTITFEAANVTEMIINTNGMKLKNSTATVNELLNTAEADSIGPASTDDQLATAKLIYDYVDTVSGSMVHNELEGLQGGTANEYYHLTNNEYSAFSSDGVTFTFTQNLAGTNLSLSGDVDAVNADFTGNLTVTGTLDVDGAVDFDSTLNVQGAATFQNNVTINETFGFNTGTTVTEIATSMDAPGDDDTLLTEKAIYDYIALVSGTITAGGSLDHNDLQNIQGGNSTQRYHLSQLEHGLLTAISGVENATSLHIHDDRYYTESEIDTISGSLQSQITQNASDISDNATAISNNTTYITNVSGSLQSQINQNASDISDNTTYITNVSGSLQSEIDSNYTTLDNKIDTTSGTLQDQLDAIDSIWADMEEPTGFTEYKVGSEISFSGNTVTISGTSEYTYYIKGEKYTKAAGSSDSVAIDDSSEGSQFIYFDGETLTSTDTFTYDILSDYAYVAVAYWDNTNSGIIHFGDERHGIIMDNATHYNLHIAEGTRYVSGLGLTDLTVDGDGSDNAHAKFGVNSGAILDEDLLHSISATASGSTIPVFYRDGAGGDSAPWRRDTNSGYAFLVGGTPLPEYNLNTGGTWTQPEITVSGVVLYHLFATNDADQPIISIMGQDVYADAAAGRVAAPNELESLLLAGLPFQEFVALATILIEGDTGFTNDVNARIISTDEGDDYIDWRFAKITSGAGSTANDHGNLSGLEDQDHPASAIYTNTTNFDGALSAADDTVQKALDTLDNSLATYGHAHYELDLTLSGSNVWTVTNGDVTGMSTADMDIYLNGLLNRDNDGEYFTASVDGNKLTVTFAYNTYENDWAHVKFWKDQS